MGSPEHPLCRKPVCRWNNQFNLTAFLDVLRPSVQPGITPSRRKERRFTTGVRVVELFTVDQRTFVVHYNSIAVFSVLRLYRLRLPDKPDQLKRFSHLSLGKFLAVLFTFCFVISRVFHLRLSRKLTRASNACRVCSISWSESLLLSAKCILNTSDQLIFIQFDARFSCSFREFSM